MLGVGIWCSASCIVAQQPIRGKVSNFSVVPDYYEQPHQAQMKSLLLGKEAEPQGDGKILRIKELKLQTFRQDGTNELIVQAPDCLYDSRDKSASSPGRLQVQTGDGKFSIEGMGFLWRQTNSSLIISNEVHTRVQPELLQTSARDDKEPKVRRAAATGELEQGGLDLWAEQFNYEAESGLANYRGKVRAAGTNLSMTSGLLTIVLPMAERRMESITAEENVVIDSGEIHASGQQVRYSVATDLVELSGEPKWRAGRQEGSGDRLEIERTNKVFRANGKSVLKLAGQGVGTNGFLPPNPLAKTNTTAATNQIVEILCDKYELRTNSAFFHNSVRLTQRVDEQPRGQLNCEVLSVGFAGTNQLESLVAEKNVVLGQEDNWFNAGKAVYTATNGIMELTENPTWKAGARDGKGDVIHVLVPKNEMRVERNAFMRLPAEQMSPQQVVQNPKSKVQSPLTPTLSPSDGEREKPLTASPTSGQTEKSSSSPNKEADFAEIFSERYTINPQGAVFEGKVRMEHPQMHWTCDRVTAEFASPEAKNGSVTGEHNVDFDLTDEKGGKVHGIGQKAVYTFGISDNRTNNFVELTGNPMIETTNGTVQNAIIIVDVATHTLALPGKFKIVGTGPGTTNLFLK